MDLNARCEDGTVNSERRKERKLANDQRGWTRSGGAESLHSYALLRTAEVRFTACIARREQCTAAGFVVAFFIDNERK